MDNKESIRFKILNNNNIPVTLTATVGEDGQLYRCGSPIYCGCSNPPAPYLYLDEEVYCPICGKKSLTVESCNSLDDIHLTYFDCDLNTMQDLYKLSDTLPYNIWNTIADLFVKLSPEDVDLQGGSVAYVGWVTSNPEAVEERLGVREDLRVCNQPPIERTRRSVTGLSETEIFDIVDKLHEVFSVVETPYGEFQLYNSSPDIMDGVAVENPLYPPNPIGNGEFWYIIANKMEIWYVRYNFRPGDDRRFNNVLIDGELKAIGKVIPYDEDVVELISRLDKDKRL